MNGQNVYDKWIHYLRGNKNNMTTDSDLNILSESVNNDYNTVMASNSNTEKLIELRDDGKIVIDPAKIEDFIQKIRLDFFEKISQIDLENIGIFLFGISNLMAYRGIKWCYDKGNKVDLNAFKSDDLRVQALKIMQNHRLLFTSAGSLIILVGMHSILYVHKQYMPNNVNVRSTSSSNKPQNSFIFLFTYFKKLNKWLKIIIIFILIPIIIYSSYPYLSYLRVIYVNFLNSNMFKFKLLVCLIIIFIILYNILELYLINKFSKLSDKPILNKYLPSKVSNKIFSIYKISQSCDNDRSLIISIILKNMISHILLLIFVLTTLLIST